MPFSKLKPRHEQIDFVFVTEHRWSETLTDPVTLTSLREGREELATLVIDLVEDVFKEALGKDYDATDGFKWLRSEGKTWLAELTDEAFTQFLAHRHEAPTSTASYPPELDESIADICARHGLQLREKGKLIEDGGKQERVIKDFFVNLICQKVRRKDSGKAVDRDTVLGWFKELDQANESSRFALAAKKVITARPGGAEALSLKYAQALVKTAGVYWTQALGRFCVFDCTLTLARSSRPMASCSPTIRFAGSSRANSPGRSVTP
jgi:hypothetical protein